MLNELCNSWLLKNSQAKCQQHNFEQGETPRTEPYLNKESLPKISQVKCQAANVEQSLRDITNHQLTREFSGKVPTTQLGAGRPTPYRPPKQSTFVQKQSKLRKNNLNWSKNNGAAFGGTPQGTAGIVSWQVTLFFAKFDCFWTDFECFGGDLFWLFFWNLLKNP